MLSEMGGRVVVRKVPEDEIDAERLAHEATVLAAARHPGVVQVLVEPAADPDGALVLAMAGTHSLETVPPLPLAELAGVMAAVAETLADLHTLGLAHGRIEPAHVVLGSGGRPILCGFGGAGPTGSVPPPSPALTLAYHDPAHPPGTPLAEAADVFGVGATLRTLLGDLGPASVEPIPDRRLSIARLLRRTPVWTGWQQRALLNLADQATEDDPARRPSARRLAAAIRAAVSEATLPAGMGDTAPAAPTAGDRSGAVDADDPFATLRSGMATAPPRRRALGTRQVATAAAAVVGLALIATGAAALAGGQPATADGLDVGATVEPREPQSPAVAESGSPTTTPPVGPQPTAGHEEPAAAGGASRACAPVANPGVPVRLAPDACPVAGRADGNRVTVGSRTWQVGNEGDEVALGDLDCDGRTDVALLRPDSGDVFIFDGFAEPGHDLRATPSASEPGAVHLTAVTGPDGCATLRVTFPDGTSAAVGQ